MRTAFAVAVVLAALGAPARDGQAPASQGARQTAAPRGPVLARIIPIPPARKGMVRVKPIPPAREGQARARPIPPAGKLLPPLARGKLKP